MNKENLLKMADYIETIPQEKFDMGVYRMDSFEALSPECDTIGCVVGHCTILDSKNVVKNFLDRSLTRIDFREWSKNFSGLTKSTYEWDWCFSYQWYEIDNTPTGAAKRIRYFVEHGLPENWLAQMNGDEPLCYLENKFSTT